MREFSRESHKAINASACQYFSLHAVIERVRGCVIVSLEQAPTFIDTEGQHKNMPTSKLLKLLLNASLCLSFGLSIAMFGPAAQVDAATKQSRELIAVGEDLLGTPYRFGAPKGVTHVFDCSSFTQYIFNELGVELPRTSRDQADVGEKVDRGSLSQGDLLFFRTTGKSISHVAVYIGDGKMIHASSSKGISITEVDSSYWKKRYVTARRVL